MLLLLGATLRHAHRRHPVLVTRLSLKPLLHLLLHLLLLHLLLLHLLLLLLLLI